VNFPALAGAVGDEGRVVGLDASRGMARRARQRAATVDGRPFPTLPLAYLIRTAVTIYRSLPVSRSAKTGKGLQPSV